MSKAKRNKERRRQRKLDRKARDIYAEAPVEPDPGESSANYSRRVQRYVDRVLQESGDEAGEVLRRLAELNQVRMSQTLTAEYDDDDVRPIATTLAAAAVLEGADVPAMLERYDELCRQAGGTVRGRLCVGSARICIFRAPDEIVTHMWLWGENPDDGHGTIVYTPDHS